MSAAPKFTLSIQVGEVADSHLWDSSSPISLGHRLPWSLDRPAGEVRLVHSSGNVFPLGTDILRSGGEIELREPDNLSGLVVSLRIQEAADLEPVYRGEDAGADAAAEWSAYAISGEWVLDARNVGRRYRGRLHGETAFVMVVRDGRVRLKFKSHAVSLRSLDSSVAPSADSSGVHEFSIGDLSRLEIASETVTWRFRRIRKPSASLITLVRPRADEETIWFRKGLGMIGAAFLLLLLTTALFVSPKEEEKKEQPQFARIVLPTRATESRSAEDLKDAGGTGGAVTDTAKNDAPKPKGVEGQVADAPAPAQEAVAEAKSVADPAPKVADAKPEATKVGRADKQPAKRVAAAPAAKPSKQVAVAKPAKPQVSQAVLQAKRLENSLSSLMGAVPTELLAKADKISKSGPKAPAFEGGGGGGGGGASGSSQALSGGSLAGSAPQRVDVGYTGHGGGSPDGRNVAGYGTGVPTGVGVAGGRGKFVSVNAAGEQPTMGEDGLTKQEVWAVINRHLSEVRYCYERAIIRRSDVEGKLVVNFVINGTGVVKTTAVKASTLADSDMDGCVQERLKTWKFPKPRGNIEVGVLYPFNFKRL